MKTIIVAAAAAWLSTGALAHDMFLKPSAYRLAPGQSTVIDLFTGTFEKSENPVVRARMAATPVSVAGRVSLIDAAHWSDDAVASHLRFTATTAGTHAIGLSTRQSRISLSATDFDDYLRHDGIEDVLAERQRGPRSGADVVERYAKHVRTVVQVGDVLTDDAARPLGFPTELLLLDNPATLGVGTTLTFRALLHGRPLPGQLVYARAAGGAAPAADPAMLKIRTAADGTGSLRIDRPGPWYLTFIHMTKSAEPGIDYESNWSTVTFEVR
jgi:uncharacterized GH25 family protein